MNEVRETGGARIGRANASWPLATLSVTKDKLEINASIAGNLLFKPGDVISITPYSGFISKGIKINHRVSAYAETVIFWTFSNTQKLIRSIEETGFLSNPGAIPPDLERSIASYQSKGGFPIRLPFAITVAVIWNALILMDIGRFISRQQEGFPLGIGAKLATGIVFLICLLLLTLPSFRKLALKEGRTIDDIRRVVFFIMIISAVLFISFSAH